LTPPPRTPGSSPSRPDLSYFVAHPCHPPLFNDEVSEEARADWFGGVHAKQHIVCALHSGPETDYARGERVARDLYAPVMESYRVTVAQMALLEPALAETFAATLVTAMKEALDETVKRAFPRRRRGAFLLGHIRIELAIVSAMPGFPFPMGEVSHR
jgi:hypothetical protein